MGRAAIILLAVATAVHLLLLLLVARTAGHCFGGVPRAAGPGVTG